MDREAAVASLGDIKHNACNQIFVLLPLSHKMRFQAFEFIQYIFRHLIKQYTNILDRAIIILDTLHIEIRCSYFIMVHKTLKQSTIFFYGIELSRYQMPRMKTPALDEKRRCTVQASSFIYRY